MPHLAASPTTIIDYRLYVINTAMLLQYNNAVHSPCAIIKQVKDVQTHRQFSYTVSCVLSLFCRPNRNVTSAMSDVHMHRVKARIIGTR